MAEFSWIERMQDAEWTTVLEGGCLRAMSWAEFSRRAQATQDWRKLEVAFRTWAESQREWSYLLTWDIPMDAGTSVYVCRQDSNTRRALQ